MVALVVPALEAPYFAELGAAVVGAAAQRGLTLLVDQTDGLAQREREVVAGLRANVVDGLILSPMTLTAEDLERTLPSLPVVLLGERIREGAHSASGVAPLRRAGYERALQSHDVPVRRS